MSLASESTMTHDGEKEGGKESRYAHPTIGFGVPKTLDPHHFQVLIPRGSKQPVLIRENLGVSAGPLGGEVVDRVYLERFRWSEIANEVKRAFNQRLKQENLAVSRWQVGENPVDRLLGKELIILAWAVENADPEKIGIAVRNWLALHQEERWWLFGMTAMAAGGVNDGERGWRLALRYALADTPQAELPMARKAKRLSGPSEDTKTLSLFDTHSNEE